jgi:hypothetical protein
MQHISLKSVSLFGDHALQKLFKIIAVIAILIAVPKIIQNVMFSESKSDIAKQMTNLVNQTNKDLPKKIDSSTTLTKADFDATTSTYRIHYTMDPGINIDQSKKDAANSFAVKQICGGDMKIILEKNITIEYLYTFNPDGGADQKMSISIPPNSCK